ncbi:hypothetical protein RY27_09250, partial [Litorilinea aerophila]
GVGLSTFLWIGSIVYFGRSELPGGVASQQISEQGGWVVLMARMPPRGQREPAVLKRLMHVCVKLTKGPAQARLSILGTMPEPR